MKPIPLTFALALAAAPALAQQTTIADIQGLWRTAIAEQPSPDGSASAWLRQSIDFTPRRETYMAEAFADEAATQPLFTYESEGPYSVVSEHETVDGALAIDLRNDRSEVTIFVDAPPLWDALGLADCPLAIGEAVEIADCVSGPPFQVADCVDLDLALVDRDGTRLRMGDGGVDRCNERPQATASIAFFRVEE